MDFSAPHIGFVIAAYALSALCLLGLCFYVLKRDRAAAAKLKQQDPP